MQIFTLFCNQINSAKWEDSKERTAWILLESTHTKEILNKYWAAKAKGLTTALHLRAEVRLAQSYKQHMNPTHRVEK